MICGVHTDLQRLISWNDVDSVGWVSWVVCRCSQTQDRCFSFRVSVGGQRLIFAALAHHDWQASGRKRTYFIFFTVHLTLSLGCKQYCLHPLDSNIIVHFVVKFVRKSVVKSAKTRRTWSQTSAHNIKIDCKFCRTNLQLPRTPSQHQMQR